MFIKRKGVSSFHVQHMKAQFLQTNNKVLILQTDVDAEIIPPIEEYCGLRAQDLQEAKDQLLVETADMLSVPLFTAEALLRNHGIPIPLTPTFLMYSPVLCSFIYFIFSLSEKKSLIFINLSVRMMWLDQT